MFRFRVVCIFLLTILLSSVHWVFAAGGTVTDPTGTAPDRYVYYPGTEELGKDEIRLFACGTGSMVNVAALMIPYDFLNIYQIIKQMEDAWSAN